MPDKEDPSYELLKYRIDSYEALAQKLNYFIEELYSDGEGKLKGYKVCNKCDARRYMDVHDKDCFIGKITHIVWWGIPR